MNSPALAIQTFGRFQVFLGAAPIPNDAWGSHRARTLFDLPTLPQAAALSDPAMRAGFQRPPHSRLILDTTL
jgi:hypothetical protein